MGYKKRIVHCRLHWDNCFAFKSGKIGKYSNELKKYLGEFDIYAKRFVDLLEEPTFLKYPDFKKMLEYFSKPQCGGSIVKKCKLFKNCRVRFCSEEKEVYFCFECPEFPYNKTGVDGHLQKRHIKINERLKEVGAINYYNEIKEKPRY